MYSTKINSFAFNKSIIYTYNMLKQNKKLKTVEKLFRYDNFLIFLEDYIAEKQKLKKGFSKRYLAQKAGFSSHSHLIHILSGKRRATDESLQKIISVLELNKKEKKFFIALARFNQSKTISERDKYFLEINKIRDKIEFNTLNKSMVSYYNKWYHSVIRELVVYSNWGEDYSILATLTKPPISVKEAKESVELLLKLKIIKKNNDKFILNHETIISGDIPIRYLKKARTDMILTSIKAADTSSINERFFNNLTVNLNKTSYNAIKEFTEEYIENIENVVMSQDESKLNQIYQFNIQMFPLSKVYKNENENENEN